MGSEGPSLVFVLAASLALAAAVAAAALYAAQPGCERHDGDCTACHATPGCAMDPASQRCNASLAAGDGSVVCAVAAVAPAGPSGGGGAATGLTTNAPTSPPVGAPVRLRSAAGHHLCVVDGAPSVRESATDAEATFRLEAGGALAHVNSGTRLHSAGSGGRLIALTATDAGRERPGEVWRAAGDKPWLAGAAAATLLLDGPAGAKTLILRPGAASTAPELLSAATSLPPGAEDVLYWEAL